MQLVSDCIGFRDDFSGFRDCSSEGSGKISRLCGEEGKSYSCAMFCRVKLGTV